MYYIYFIYICMNPDSSLHSDSSRLDGSVQHNQVLFLAFSSVAYVFGTAGESGQRDEP